LCYPTAGFEAPESDGEEERHDMVKLRLARFGAKKRPYYRIVAMDSQSKRDGRYLELLGTYDPLQNPPAITVVEERVKYWLSVGAQASDSVASLLKTHEKAQPAAK
jgi:small subunit ribosomal protein S16